MSDLSDILNETIRAEIEDFLDDPNEIQTAIDLFSNASEQMQLIAEAVIMGEDDEVDRITQAALEDGVEALEVMDDGLIAGMSIVGIKFRENGNCRCEVSRQPDLRSRSARGSASYESRNGTYRANTFEFRTHEYGDSSDGDSKGRLARHR